MTRKGQHLIAVFFISSVVCADAARIESSESNKIQLASNSTRGGSSIPEDLDFQGCGSLSCNGEGCFRKYIWLDTPRQSCRYTDDYKLSHRQEEFGIVELERLLYKTEKFKSTGCIFGTGASYDTYMWKCIRRTTQIMRLTQFLGKLRKAAEMDKEHPAHELVNGEDFKNTMESISTNIMAGLDKSQEGSHAQFSKALDALRSVPTMPVESDLPEAAKQAQEQAQITASMLQAVGVELTKEQQAEVVEAAGELNGMDGDVDVTLEAMMSDVEEGMINGAVDEDGLTSLSDDKKAGAMQSLQEVGDDGAAPSLLEEASNSSIATTGSGPLKWVFKHGIGWIVTRIFWVLLFSLGSALGLIRTALFPVLFVGCVLVKFLSWITLDVIYWGGWEGRLDKVTRGFLNMGRCPAQMWGLIGFDADASNVAGQIFIQPALFASDVTGVVHPIYSAKNLCKNVECSEHAYCYAGKCTCKAGFYPLGETGHCGLASTTHGCVCAYQWRRRALIFESLYNGCPAAFAECQVDVRHPSYSHCKGRLKKRSSLVRWLWGAQPAYDTCSHQTMHQSVPALSSSK